MSTNERNSQRVETAAPFLPPNPYRLEQVISSFVHPTVVIAVKGDAGGITVGPKNTDSMGISYTHLDRII